MMGVQDDMDSPSSAVLLTSAGGAGGDATGAAVREITNEAAVMLLAAVELSVPGRALAFVGARRLSVDVTFDADDGAAAT
jgi:hypothetical protein